MISVFQHTSRDALRVAIMSGVCGCGCEFVVSMFVVSDCGICVVCECCGVFVVIGSGSLTT